MANRRQTEMADDGRKVVVITGASAGVGRATARAFAERGAGVALLARGEDRLKATATQIEDLGGKALSLPTDVANVEQVEAAADAVERELGPIDVWVNNAMTSVFGPFWEMAPEDFRRVTEVTYLGVVNGTRSALRRMLPRDRGVIVEVGSALAFRGIPLQSAYCGSKHAIQGFTDSLRTELLHHRSNVRLTSVHLPALNTPQFDWVKSLLPRRAQPVPPIYQPEVAARAIVWASDHERRTVWVGASTWGTIVANRIFPGILDRYLGATGFDSQQTGEPEDRDRRNNLYDPVPGDFGAHGRFDDQAKDRSLHLWLTTHRRALGAALGTGALGLALLRRRDR